MLRSLRVLVWSVMGGVVLIGLVLVLLLPGESDASADPPYVVLGGIVALGVVLHIVIEAVGYRASPIDPATPPEQAVSEATTAMQTSTTLRLALADVAPIVSLALAFEVDRDGIYLYLAGALIGLALLGYHAFPWSRPVGRVDAALQRDGAASPLRSALGLPPA